MLSIPDPLHPAVVHFPVALLLVGCFLACVAMVWRRWALPAALILFLGASGAIVAVETGEREADRVGELAQAADHLLDEHAEAGEMARTLGVVAAGLAILSCLSGRWMLLSRALAVGCAIVSLAAAWQVATAGHYGGMLVYHQGVGIREGFDAKRGGVPNAAPSHGESEQEHD